MGIDVVVHTDGPRVEALVVELEEGPASKRGEELVLLVGVGPVYGRVQGPWCRRPGELALHTENLCRARREVAVGRRRGSRSLAVRALPRRVPLKEQAGRVDERPSSPRGTNVGAEGARAVVAHPKNERLRGRPSWSACARIHPALTGGSPRGEGGGHVGGTSGSGLPMGTGSVVFITGGGLFFFFFYHSFSLFVMEIYLIIRVKISLSIYIVFGLKMCYVGGYLCR